MKKTYLLFFCLTLFSLTACSRTKYVKGPQTQNVLGTVSSINLFEDGTSDLYTECFNLLKQIENEFSVNISSSTISRINEYAGKEAVPVSEDVFFLIKKALFYAEISGGDFDPTIGPVVKLWGIGTGHERVPSQNEIDEALKLVDWTKVVLSAAPATSTLDNSSNAVASPDTAGTVFLQKEGMALDLGAIAKGFAADKLAVFLEQRNVSRALINLGGNVYVYGSKADGSEWNIGIKNPLNVSGDPALLVKLNFTGTVVTSGAYERFFESGGKNYHHIINPHTGYPARNTVLSSTIVSDSSSDADALSTIAFIKDIKAFRKLEGALKSEGIKADAVFIEANGKIYADKELKKSLSRYSGSFYEIEFY